MPRTVTPTKEVPNYFYPPKLKAVMEEFERRIEEIRADASKAGRNLKACQRARVNLQKLRFEFAPKLRKALFDERDRLEALRHGMALNEWRNSHNRRS